MLLVAATPLRRTQAAEMLRISQGRLARACAMLQADPPRGLRLQEAGDTLGLVSGPQCADTVERHLGQPPPEALSQATLDTLAIIAYEQPVTRADIRGIRKVDSDAVVETLRARGLVAEAPPLRWPRPAWLSRHHAGIPAVLRAELAQQSATSRRLAKGLKTVALAPTTLGTADCAVVDGGDKSAPLLVLALRHSDR